MDLSNLVFLDTETTGLNPDRHEIWELATIEFDSVSQQFKENQWQLPVDLTQADPGALRINRFYQRRSEISDNLGHLFINQIKARKYSTSEQWERHEYFLNHIAEEIAIKLAGKVIVAANPAFDTEFLKRFLRAHNQQEAWDYHLLDIEAYIAGANKIVPPYKSDLLFQLAGINLTNYNRHTAIGDARIVRDAFISIIGGGINQ